MTQRIPISLVIADEQQKQALQQIVTELKSTELHSGDASQPSVLIYQPGSNVQEMLPQISAAIQNGELIAVILAASNPHPKLLIEAMRAGITEYISFPVKKEDVATAISRAAGKQQATQKNNSGQIITVLGSRGGLGATTLAVNLACALHRPDSPAALLDLVQPQGDVPLFLDLDYSYTWRDLTDNISRMDETYLRSSLSTHKHGLSVIPAPYAAGRPQPQALATVLVQLKKLFKRTIIDTSFAPEDTALAEIEQADTLILPTQLTLPGLAWTRRQLETVRQYYPEKQENLHLILCRHVKDTGIEPEDAEEILERSIRWIIAENPSQVTTALNQGTPVVEAFPNSPTANNILEIAAAFGVKDEKKKSFSLKSVFNKFRKQDDVTGKSTVGGTA